MCKFWFAVMRDSDDGWDDGTYDLDEAIEKVHEYRMGGYGETNIAVIEEADDPFCVQEINPDYTAEEVDKMLDGDCFDFAGDTAYVYLTYRGREISDKMDCSVWMNDESPARFFDEAVTLDNEEYKWMCNRIAWKLTEV